jgi:hypothetical protein
MSSGAIISTGLRGSIVRLLKGDVRESDLRDLFFSMRAESGGSGIVSEIAHFIAHPDRRTQGIIVREVSDCFAFAKLRAELDNRLIITGALPHMFREAMRGNLRRMRKMILKRETGLDRAEAHVVLERVLGKTSLESGRAQLTPQETMVAECVFSNLKVNPLFNEHDVFEDFCRISLRLSLLDPSEKITLKKLKPAFALFALTVMHNKIIDLGNNDEAALTIAADRKKRLAIYARSKVKGPGGQSPTMGFPLFETELPITTYCEAGIAPPDRSPFIGDFQMTDGIKLAHRI